MMSEDIQAILICVIYEVGKETHGDSENDHPDDSVKEILTINKVSDAMDGGFLG